MENSDLIINIKKGDAQSLELLFRRLYPRLCAYARLFLQDANDSEEIVQELFYTLWKHRSRLDENKSLTHYLFTSTKNSCLNFLKSKQSRSKYSDMMRFLYVQELSDSVNSYHVLLAKELEKDFDIALNHLPQECRKVFELSRFEGLKYQEIATKLNISIKTVETQMSRALSKLRVQLREHLA
jgi:RNA polymerase sigma-70 factor (ECF subfamily)